MPIIEHVPGDECAHLLRIVGLCRTIKSAAVLLLTNSGLSVDVAATGERANVPVVGIHDWPSRHAEGSQAGDVGEQSGGFAVIHPELALVPRDCEEVGRELQDGSNSRQLPDAGRSAVLGPAEVFRVLE